MATAALDAQVLVDDGFFDVIQVQMLPVGHARHGMANQVLELEPLVVEECAKAIDKIINDLEPVHHRRGTDLDVARPKRQEVDGITPIRYATDPGDRDRARLPRTGNLGNHVECDRFDGLATIATVRAHAIGCRVHGQRVVVDAHDRINCVDQRNGVGAAFHRCPGRRQNTGDVGRELDDDRN